MSRLLPAALALTLTAAAASTAEAAVIIDIWDDGSNLHAAARGSLQLPAGPADYPAFTSAFLYGNQPAFGTGVDDGGAPDNGYSIAVAANLFASRGVGNASAATGPVMSFSPGSFVIDKRYVSGTPYQATARWDGWTLSLAGLYSGIHQYSIGSDTITLAIGDAAIAELSDVPAPAAAPLLLGALGLLGWARRKA